MTKLTTVSNAFETALNSLHDFKADLIDSLDQKKNQLLGLLDSIAADTNDLSDLGKVCGVVGRTLLAIESDCATIVSNIDDTVLSINDIPAGSLGTFVDYCATCGKELHISDVYMNDGDGEIQCMDCVEKFAAAEANDVAEDDDNV